MRAFLQLIWLRSDLRVNDNTALGRRCGWPLRGGVSAEPGAMAGTR
jgi:hypothetical protein